jgi:hypothetical protein
MVAVGNNMVVVVDSRIHNMDVDRIRGLLQLTLPQALREMEGREENVDLQESTYKGHYASLVRKDTCSGT